MYSQLYKTLQLDESHLMHYLGYDLQGFNDTTTKSWGYVEQLITFGEKEKARQVKIFFLVIDFPSFCTCILGQPTLAEITVVPSTIHL